MRLATRTLEFRTNASYLIVGGLRGICGSLAMYMSLHGARHLIVMARTGCDDEISQGVVFQLKALGTEVTIVKGDVINTEDVERAFEEAPKPIAGVIQGVMLLRVRSSPMELVGEIELTNSG